MKNHRMKLIIAASLVLLLGLAAAAAFRLLDRQPTLSESEIEAIARAWTDDNMDGAARDELIEFIVANTTVNSQIMLRMYLRRHVASGATWTYGPFESAGNGSYDAYATVDLRFSDIMPPPVVSDEIKALGEAATTMPVEPGDYRNVFALTFLLTVDPAPKSVTDWRVHDGEAVYVYELPPW